MTAPAVKASREPGSGLRFWHLLVSLSLGTLGFFLPYSSAGVSVSLAALVFLALARPGILVAAAPWKEPVMATGLALLAFIAVHTMLLTGWQRSALEAVNHYQELLLAPLLLAFLHDTRLRRIFFHALITGAVFLALLHWAALATGTMTPFLANRRISAGFALAVCAFLVLMQARDTPSPWPARGLAAFLALTVLFAVDGRTGHIVLLLLVACAAWLHSSGRHRWLITLSCVLFVLVIALTSKAVSTRVNETLAVARGGANSVVSSTDIRIELARLSVDLAKEHGLRGAGFANYPAVHTDAVRDRYGNGVNHRAQTWILSAGRTNPHNEYLMQLISGGVLAALLFVAWLGLALREAARARVAVGGMMAGVVLAFAVGSLFNSLLLDFVEGHLYMALLAWLLAEARHAPEEDRRHADMKSILVIATRQIGDVLLTTPLVHAARNRWPQARIEVLGFEGTVGMLRGNPDVDRLIEAPARTGLRPTAGLARQLWRRYDLALVTDPGDRAHLLGWIAAPERSGIIPAKGGSNWLKLQALDHAVIAAGDLGDVHAAAEKQSLLAPWMEGAAGVPQVVPPPASPLPDTVQSVLRTGAVVIHAPSMWPYKQWPLVHFETLVKALLDEGRQVVLTGSAGQRDQECVAPLRALAPSPQLLDLSGQLDFNQLVTLFQQAALYIGPDTSVSHLAASTGVPVIAILGPTNPMRWAPWPAKADANAIFERSTLQQQAGNVTVLQSGLHCVPCGKAGCEDHRQSRSDCLVDITPDRVLEQARKILAS